MPSLVGLLSRLEVHHVNLPIAVLIWLMIHPMMLRIDFTALRGVGQRPTRPFQRRTPVPTSALRDSRVT